MCGTMHNVDNIAQETLDKIMSKMCEAQSELRELNHKHDEIKMEHRILRCATERMTNKSNDINSTIENNVLQVEFKTNETLEMLKKQRDLKMML